MHTKLSKRLIISLFAALLLTSVSLVSNYVLTDICNSKGEIPGSHIVDQRGWPLKFVYHVQFTECTGQALEGGDIGAKEGTNTIYYAELIADFVMFTLISFIALSIATKLFRSSQHHSSH